MINHPSIEFTHALCRKPANTLNNALRLNDVGNPDITLLREHHLAYVEALKNAGCNVRVLEPLDNYPDSVFIEDAALCLKGIAIILRPGAPSRFGEAAALIPDAHTVFNKVVTLAGPGSVDGGDILATDTDVFVGLSERTNSEGASALKEIVESLGYTLKVVQTPKEILHFKSDCALLDHQTIFSTTALASSGCFDGYQVITAPSGEEAAANLIRVNNTVFMADGFPLTQTLLKTKGYSVVALKNSEAAKVDGGLSCMSLRFSLPPC